MNYKKIALIGQPNVGKSSMINAIVWKDRVMVKDMAGTTRDSIDTKFKYEDTDFVLIDTAWIRRLSKVWTRNVENWSVMRSQRSLKRADIVAVVVSKPLLLGVYENNKLIKTVKKEGKTSDVLPLIFDELLKYIHHFQLNIQEF